MRITTAIFSILSKIGDLFVPPIPPAYHNWQPTRSLLELPPMGIQTSGGLWMPMNDGKPWPGPAGSLRAYARGDSFYRRRDTGVLAQSMLPPMPPVQNTGAMRKIRPTRLTPIPETFEVQIIESTVDKRVSEALAQIPVFDPRTIDNTQLAWMYVDLPVLAPLATGDLAVSDRVAHPVAEERTTDAFEELMRHDSGTLEVPSVTREIAERHKR